MMWKISLQINALNFRCFHEVVMLQFTALHVLIHIHCRVTDSIPPLAGQRQWEFIKTSWTIVKEMETRD